MNKAEELCHEGIKYMLLARYEKAIECFNKSLEINPEEEKTKESKEMTLQLLINDTRYIKGNCAIKEKTEPWQ